MKSFWGCFSHFLTCLNYQITVRLLSDNIIYVYNIYQLKSETNVYV